MADNPAAPNVLTAVLRGRSTTPGDLPDGLKGRYYVEDRGDGLGFYADATVQKPAFRDRGDRLITTRNDPDAIGHMARIALHREWSIIVVRGAPDFRREAWLAGRALGLEVRGYRPTERDHQALQGHLAADQLRRDRSTPGRNPDPQQPSTAHQIDRPGPQAHLKAVEAVVRRRVSDLAEQARILAGAHERLAHWLDRGATFEVSNAQARQPSRHERGRSH
jgi:hypothetical protein